MAYVLSVNTEVVSMLRIEIVKEGNTTVSQLLEAGSKYNISYIKDSTLTAITGKLIDFRPRTTTNADGSTVQRYYIRVDCSKEYESIVECFYTDEIREVAAVAEPET